MTQHRTPQNILMESLIMSMVKGPSAAPIPTGDPALDAAVLEMRNGLQDIAKDSLLDRGIQVRSVDH